MSHIFISYSRKDINFAHRLVDALAANDLDTWIDWEGIPKGEDWWKHIRSGIEEADAFVFLVSPDSLKSVICSREIDHAVKNGKRILPVVLRSVDSQDIHPEILRWNWIYCIDEHKDFDTAILKLRKTVHTDYEWLQYQTRLQNKALAWKRTGDSSRLLRGLELHDAETQLSIGTKEPQPTDLQRDYVETSRKRIIRQQRWIFAIFVASLTLLLFLFIFARDQTDIRTERARIALAEDLAAQSANLRKSDITVSMLLGIEAFRINESLQTLSVVRDNAQASQLNISWEGSVKTPDDSPIPTNIVYSVAISPDGKTIASGSQDGLVSLWNMETGQVIGQPLSGHSDRVQSVAFSPDGKLLATGSQDRTIILWNVESEELITQLVSTQDSVAGVNSLSFSPDGKLLASDIAASTVIWDIGPRQVFHVLSGEQFRSIRHTTFSPDGKTLAVCGGPGIFFWDVNSKQLVEDQFSASCNIIRYSPDGKILAGGFGDVVNLWNTETGDAIGESLRGHFGTVQSVAFSPDGKTLASASWGGDNTIILWDVETRQSIGQPLSRHSDSIYSIVFSPDGRKLISGSRDETVVVWDVDPQYLIQKTCEHVGRNFTQTEWQQYFPDEEYRITCPQRPVGE